MATVLEASNVVSEPQLPVGLGPPQVRLHLGDPGVPLLVVLQHYPLGRECFDLCLVDDILWQALTTKWTVGLVLFVAATGLGGVALADDLGVVGGNDVPQVGHRPEADLDGVTIQHQAGSTCPGWTRTSCRSWW